MADRLSVEILSKEQIKEMTSEARSQMYLDNVKIYQSILEYLDMFWYQLSNEERDKINDITEGDHAAGLSPLDQPL